MPTILGIWLGGGVGAMARYGVDRAWPRSLSLRFPWAILLVNLSGSFAIGFLFALFSGRVDLPGWARATLTVGFLGGYTTFSTLSLDTFRLLDGGRIGAALANGVGSLTLGVVAAWVGVRLGGTV